MTEPDQDTTEDSADLIEVARIYSRPEAICLASALEDGGIQTYMMGFHFGALPHQTVANGGYSVRVPAYDAGKAVELIAELRLQTEPLPVSKSLRRRLWFWLGGGAAYAAFFSLGSPSGFLWLWFASMGAPFPITVAGDYRSRSGKLMQLR